MPLSEEEALRLHAVEVSLLSDCERWAALATRHLEIASQLAAHDSDLGRRGTISKPSPHGDTARERVSAVVADAKKCTDVALMIRRQLLGQKAANASELNKLIPPDPEAHVVPNDPATVALLEKMGAKKLADEVKKAQRAAARVIESIQ